MSRDKRPAHVLRAEKTLAIPRHIIFFDTESEMLVDHAGSIEHRLKLGWACYLRRGDGRRPDRKDWLFFTNAAAFWQFVFDHAGAKNKLWVIAHQLNFDFTVVGGFAFLRRADYKCKFFYAAAATTLIKVRKKGASIMFVDSLNWFKESLEKIGARIGVPKMTIDFETADFSYLKTYCKRDVEILLSIFEHLVRFLQANRISRLCYTIGSTAMAAFLFRHYREKIYIHNNTQAIDLERAAYKGGRTECFFLGALTDGPYHVVDVNSLYPFVMRNNLFPVRYERILHNVGVDTLRAYLKSRAVTAAVTIETPEPVFAVRRDRTLFPIGRFAVTLSTPELRYALQHDYLRSVQSAVIYKQAKIFTGYVDRFYSLRRDFVTGENPLFAEFAKVLLNSLYGKFGQKAEQWQKIGDAPDEADRIEDVIDAVTGRRRRLRYLLGEVSEMTGYTESLHSFPAIAAHVTAFARLYLWRIMGIAGVGNYFYCDTDSLFVNERGLSNLSGLLDDTELGKLKTESTHDTLTIHGLKDYAKDDRSTIKGIRKAAIRISDTEYRQEQWPTLRGILRSGCVDTYKTASVVKTLTREYTKGIVSASGLIRPVRFAE